MLHHRRPGLIGSLWFRTSCRWAWLALGAGPLVAVACSGAPEREAGNSSPATPAHTAEPQELRQDVVNEVAVPAIDVGCLSGEVEQLVRSTAALLVAVEQAADGVVITDDRRTTSAERQAAFEASGSRYQPLDDADREMTWDPMWETRRVEFPAIWGCWYSGVRGQRWVRRGGRPSSQRRYCERNEPLESWRVRLPAVSESPYVVRGVVAKPSLMAVLDQRLQERIVDGLHCVVKDVVAASRRSKATVVCRSSEGRTGFEVHFVDSPSRVLELRPGAVVSVKRPSLLRLRGESRALIAETGPETTVEVIGSAGCPP